MRRHARLKTEEPSFASDESCLTGEEPRFRSDPPRFASDEPRATTEARRPAADVRPVMLEEPYLAGPMVWSVRDDAR
jgi:hypothetical protein